MDIVVPFSIRKKELDGEVPGEAKKVFAKIKEKPNLAEQITAKGLPDRTTLYKVYATTAGGARRLLFFCRRPPPPTQVNPGEKSLPVQRDRWVLLFYRDKSDAVGKNTSHKNPSFVTQLERNLRLALNDIATSTPAKPLFEQF